MCAFVGIQVRKDAVGARENVNKYVVLKRRGVTQKRILSKAVAKIWREGEINGKLCQH